MAAFATRFSKPEAIARARLSAGVVRHFRASGTIYDSLETLEAVVGSIVRPWAAPH